MKTKKKVILAVCGSVAAIESPKIARRLIKKDIKIECVMSSAAAKIIHPNTMEWSSKNSVVTKITGKVEYLKLCSANDKISLLLICPATANTISKIANGICDSAVTSFATTALGYNIPIIIVPAMHLSMYNNPFLQENIKKLKKNKVKFIAPKITEEKAKLVDNDKIVKFVLNVINKK